MHFFHKNVQSIIKKWFDSINRNGFRLNKSIKSKIIWTLVGMQKDSQEME